MVWRCIDAQKLHPERHCEFNAEGRTRLNKRWYPFGTHPLGRSSVEAYFGLLLAIVAMVVPMTIWLRVVLWALFAAILIDLSWRSPLTVNRRRWVRWVATLGSLLLTLVLAWNGTVGQYRKEHARKLTPRQRAEFIDTLRAGQRPHESIRIGCPQSSEEACIFPGKFIEYFKEARWTVERDAVDRLVLPKPVAGVAIFKRGAGVVDPSNPKSGLWVQQTPDLETVKRAFAKIGLAT